MVRRAGDSPLLKGVSANAGAREPQPVPFLRAATGLVRGWSMRDAAVYALLSTNVITLGIVEFASGPPIRNGQLLSSILISGVWVSFLVVTYAGLIVTIPRSGGDYIWQSRILGGPLGFVMSATGWWFILWLWAPIYGSILSEELAQPLSADLGDRSAATWFAGRDGTFFVCLVTIALACILVSLGMKGYARVQKYCVLGGIAGFTVMVIVMLVSSRQSFVSSVDHYGSALFGVKNSYQANLAAGGGSFRIGFFPLGPSMLLVPMMMFYLLWPNWGSTLYGEVRGSSDFKRVFGSMFVALWTTVILSVIFLLVAAKTFGWDFYNNANAAWTKGAGPFGIFPYPAMLAGWLVHNQAFQVFLLLIMSLWFFGWVGTLFLSSTRVIFATAFDRLLPDVAATVSEKRRVPVASLLLMLLPAVGLSALYAYWGNFHTYTLDATLVIAVTYLFSATAAVLLPLRKKALWDASPASRLKILGVPVVPVAALITIGLIGFNLYEWLSSGTYGVNNHDSLVFMGILYVLAIAVYAAAYLIRKRQGIDVALVQREIPSE
jgi:basic amino acid/polyamine antiporter, APA family